MNSQVRPENGRKRKALLVLPLLVIPLLTMAFWALGGGKNQASSHKKEKEGLNLELPGAQLEGEKDQNKLRVYEAAQRDSVKWKDLLKSDPFYQLQVLPDTTPFPVSQTHGLNHEPPFSKNTEYKDANEEKVYHKLAELNGQLGKASTRPSGPFDHNNLPSSEKDLMVSEDIDRLEGMMQRMRTTAGPDPELDQLDGMMEKILDIQHPGRVQEKSERRKTGVFSVSQSKNRMEVSCLGEQNTDTAGKTGNEFYSTAFNKPENAGDNAIAAVIHETQTLATGSTVKLRLLADIYVNGNLLSKGSFVFGTASLENERLLINIPGIRHANNLLPVSLNVYDMDGLAGVYIPGSISRNAAKQAADQSLQSVELMSFDPSVKAQAATAGIQAAKGLLSKKLKLVKVTVKAGYRVLLKDGNEQETN